MIKSLLGDDENTKKEQKEMPEINGEREDSTENTEIKLGDVKTQENVKTKSIVVDTPGDEVETIDEIKTAIETGQIPSKESEKTLNNNPQTVQPFEVNKPIGQPISKKNVADNNLLNEQKEEIIQQENKNSKRTLELEKKLREIEDELKKEKESEGQRLRKEATEKVLAEQQKLAPTEIPDTENVVTSKPEQTNIFEDNWDKDNEAKKAEDDNSIQIKPKDFIPESRAEGVRKMGMAWSAAIAFFGSVVFMLVLGWGADILLGTEPWGIVVGIIIGAAIGFIQLIRTTSQIFKPNKPSDFDIVSLKSNLETVDGLEDVGNVKKVEVKNDNKKEEKIKEIKPENSLLEVINDTGNNVAESETVVKTDG